MDVGGEVEVVGRIVVEVAVGRKVEVEVLD